MGWIEELPSGIWVVAGALVGVFGSVVLALVTSCINRRVAHRQKKLEAYADFIRECHHLEVRMTEISSAEGQNGFWDPPRTDVIVFIQDTMSSLAVAKSHVDLVGSDEFRKIANDAYLAYQNILMLDTRLIPFEEAVSRSGGIHKTIDIELLTDRARREAAR